jgi:hypothetical protein
VEGLRPSTQKRFYECTAQDRLQPSICPSEVWLCELVSTASGLVRCGHDIQSSSYGMWNGGRHLYWHTRMSAMSFCNVVELYCSCTKMALTEYLTLVQLDRSSITSPATTLMSQGPLLRDNKNQININLQIQKALAIFDPLKPKWLLRVYSYVPTHTKSLHSAHAVYLCVPYGFHNKQRLFP